MIIFSIESSCDETAAAITQNGRHVLAGVVSSQTDIHKKYGGVVPEIASRMHIESLAGLAEEALKISGLSRKDINAVAVTVTPGLIGALLTGLGFAKAVAYSLNLPLIPVNHVYAHIAANYIEYPELEPPFVSLVASGGHTLFCDVKSYTEIEILGSTRDDAAGECFDKIARALSLSYPGGKEMDELGHLGNESAFKFPKPIFSDNEFDCSFSGLKTSVINLIHNCEQKNMPVAKNDIAASFNKTIVDILIPRILRAAEVRKRDKICVAGGVAANSHVRSALKIACLERDIKIYIPSIRLCGDNSEMVGCAGYYEYLNGNTAALNQNAFANAF